MDRFAPLSNPATTASFRIPTARTPIIGRQNERARIAAAIRQGARLVTLVGTGGVGKTRLALAVAEDLSPAYAGRVGWVSLGELADPELLIDSIARSLDISTPGDAALAGALGDRPAVLVIDNMEHLAAAAERLGALLEQIPALVLLVTSRVPLRLIGEREVRVDPFPAIGLGGPGDLADHPAVRLFVERAQAVDSTFTPDARDLEHIARIVAQLDFLPLAIELAAARVRHFSLEEIDRLLAERLDLLTGGPRDAPGRHRTIRGAIEWSYRLLGADEQRIFRALSVFPGAFSLESALKLAESAEFTRVDTIDLLSALVDQNLLMRLDEPGTGRYAMLSAIRSYGQSELIAHDEEPVLRALFAEQVLERIQPRMAHPDEDIAWLELVERSMDDVRAAVAWAIGQGNGEVAIGLVSVLASWWTSRGNPREGARLYDQAFPLATNIPDTVRFPALGNYAWVLMLSGEPERAMAMRPEILALSESIGDAKTRLRANNLLGALEVSAGDLDRGRAYMQQGLAIADAAGLDDLGRGMIFNLATIAEVSKDYETALAYHRKGLALLDRERNPGMYTMHLLGIASLQMRAGHLQEADRQVREVWPSVAELRSMQVVVGALNIKSELLILTDDFERAARLFGAADHLIEVYGRVLTVFETTEVEALRTRIAEALPPDSLAAAALAGASMEVADLSADMLHAIESGPTVAPASPSILTPRESEVVSLLVEGKTNPEIASALFISERTVQSHVANVMSKLGVSSRTAVAARALRDGLVREEA